mgnify:FL=1
MKKVFVLISIFFLFFSCTSKNIIPGAKQLEIVNINNEYINIADTYFSLEKFDKAAEYYKLGLPKADSYWTVYYKLAKCYALQSKWSDALPMFQELLERDQENLSLKSSVAYIYAMSGKTEEAKQIYTELMNIHPENSSFLE